MANDVYTYVEKCAYCRRHRKHPTHQRLLQLFLPEGSLELVAIDTLDPLPKMENGNRFFIFIIDNFAKLTRAIPTVRTTVANVAEVSLEA